MCIYKECKIFYVPILKFELIAVRRLMEKMELRDEMAISLNNSRDSENKILCKT